MTTPARVVLLPRDTNRLRVEELRLPDPGPHQVVVRQLASGICHTQLHQLHAPRAATTLLGHESTGIVLARGRAVTRVREGDRVVVSWLPAATADPGRIPGAAVLPLPDGSAAFSTDVFTWADHTLADELFVVRIPHDTPVAPAAIVGCAALTGVGAVLHSAGVRAGESVAIFGVGGVGLCAVLAARRCGAGPIIAVDLDDEKLSLARALGATHGLNAAREDPVAAIHRLTPAPEGYTVLRQPASGVDWAFEVVGIERTLGQALQAVRPGRFGAAPGGSVVVVAAQTPTVSFGPIDLLLGEKRVIGSLGGSSQLDRDVPTLLEWQRAGTLPLDALIGERFALEQIGSAVEALAAGRLRGRALLEF